MSKNYLRRIAEKYSREKKSETGTWISKEHRENFMNKNFSRIDINSCGKIRISVAVFEVCIHDMYFERKVVQILQPIKLPYEMYKKICSGLYLLPSYLAFIFAPIF